MASSSLRGVVDGPASAFRRGCSATAARIVDCGNSLGECIAYDDRTNEVLWTDIYGREFHALNVSTFSHAVYPLPKMLCAFGLLKEGPGYLFCWEDGFQLYDVVNGAALSDVSEGEDVNPEGLPTRLNDGRCCPSGRRFVCGGYYGDKEEVTMKVFKVEMLAAAAASQHRYKLRHEPLAEGLQVTNSICWSPDGKLFYLVDSLTRTIHKYDYCLEKGAITNKRAFCKVDEGLPDGSCCDADGNVWNAAYRGGAGKSFVRCIDPSGEAVFRVDVPDNTSCLTCCCLGGPDLDVLFASSARFAVDREEEPRAGGVYAVKLAGVRGRAEDRLGLEC